MSQQNQLFSKRLARRNPFVRSSLFIDDRSISNPITIFITPVKYIIITKTVQ
jgi:hypothetical protein